MIDLKNLTAARRLPPRILIYSQPKMGKSTWASQSPSPIFFDIEKGAGEFDVSAIDVNSFDDVLDGLKALWSQENEFRTVIMDSLDWLYPLAVDAVCEAHKVETIEKVGQFGAGYIEVDKLLKKMLSGLDYLRIHKGMSIILICHAEIRTATPTDGDPYDYAAIKLQKRVAALVQEWVDVIGYAHQPRIVKKGDNKNKSLEKYKKAYVKGDRMLFIGHNPAYVTGNRYGLPDELPLEWAAFEDAMGNR